MITTRPEVEVLIFGDHAIQSGNTDLPLPSWVPTEVQPSTRDLPIYPALAALFRRREPTPAQVQAMAAAQLARVDAAFNDTDAEIRRLHGLMARDGFVPDRRKSRRAQA